MTRGGGGRRGGQLGWHWVRACPCPAGSCSGWGDAHYETFDGTAYSFRDNCTHVLVQEIRPRYGNLSILMHNRYCQVDASCPRALSVHYEAVEIILTTTRGASGQQESLVSVGSQAGARLARPGQGGPGPRSRGPKHGDWRAGIGHGGAPGTQTRRLGPQALGGICALGRMPRGGPGAWEAGP